MDVSEVSKKIQKAKIRVMYDLARQMDDVISLTVGEPDFQTPKSIIDVSNKYFDMGYTKYTPNPGIDELRTAIAEHYENIIHRPIDPFKNTIVTVGAQEVLFVAMQIITNPGDEILICTPHYPSYINQAHFAHCTPVLVPTREEDNWVPRAEEIESRITDKTKMLILTSPCNPTGAEIDEETLRRVAELCVKHQIVVISDEVYNEIRYSDKPFVSIGSMPGMEDLCLIANSFSKTYAMPGWRMGYAVGPEWLISEMPKCHDTMVSCVCRPFQLAGVHALKNCKDEVASMREIYRRRRDIVYEGINRIDKLSAVKPMGAFYLFFNIKETGLSSDEFAFKLLEEEKVALVPGTGFGDAGEGYMRLTYAAEEGDLKTALERIEHFVSRL